MILRYRGGKSSFGAMVGQLIISQFIESKSKSRWRIGNDINKCILCGKCEATCSAGALKVNKAAKTWTLNNYRCHKCLSCLVSCPIRCLNQIRL